MGDKKFRVTLDLQKGLVESIDDIAKKYGVKRSDFIRHAAVFLIDYAKGIERGEEFFYRKKEDPAKEEIKLVYIPYTPKKPF